MKPQISLPDNKDDERRAYRMVPVQQDPIVLFVDQHKVELQDLSTRGVAFMTSQPLQGGQHKAKFSFLLEGKDITLHCRIDIVHKSTTRYAGKLVDLDVKDEKLLSQFILQCQKDAILRQKRAIN
ncbi:hypothetical protein DN062_00825 [Nitrincola tibetensis]|uniref:PilZ domain-containing protein n=1 Tax=Nitrincola tibetensis TaxID=2219697 RepID=A0A364NRB9_9GAMM|nr:PilZ domain-containing protein [Nitrincola tibetensis]RAU19658.1 hypothetical protein DN062_00825 [Nitrincola tibetensis]